MRFTSVLGSDECHRVLCNMAADSKRMSLDGVDWHYVDAVNRSDIRPRVVGTVLVLGLLR